MSCREVDEWRLCSGLVEVLSAQVRHLRDPTKGEREDQAHGRADCVPVGNTHADIHVAAVVCPTSHRLLGVSEFETTLAGRDPGKEELLVWMAGRGRIDAVGIEGTGSNGAGLARLLTEQAVELVEVTRPDHQALRAQGQSDPVGAKAAARAVLSGRATARPSIGTG